MKLKILDTGMHTARENMAIDSALLEDLAIDKVPLLHLYEWEQDAATYGHFIDPKKIFKKEGLDLAKRPTGGGVIFHVADFAFSILIPDTHPDFSLNSLENYAFINERISKAVAHLGTPKLLADEPLIGVAGGVTGYCMAKPTKYDVMVGGKKIAGAAQRRTRHGYLHQGSISLAHPPKEFLTSYLDDSVVDAMMALSYAPLGNSWTKCQLEEARQEVKQKIIEEFS